MMVYQYLIWKYQLNLILNFGFTKVIKRTDISFQMGASLHDLDAAGQTALHYAVSNYGQASAEITEFLVAAGCDVNAR